MIQAPILLRGHNKSALLIEADTYEEILQVVEAMGISVEDCDEGEIMPWEESDPRELH